MFSSPLEPPATVTRSATVTNPPESGAEVENEPASGASNGTVGSEALAGAAFVEAAAGAASSRAGVPARRAQPDASGPLTTHTAMAAGPARAATPPTTRAAPGPSRATATRQRTASTTAAAEPSATSPNQPALASLPVPNAWRSATGHD